MIYFRVDKKREYLDNTKNVETVELSKHESWNTSLSQGSR